MKSRRSKSHTQQHVPTNPRNQHGYCIAAMILLSEFPRYGTRIASRSVEPHEGGGRVVLNNLSEQIRECYRHADDCARKAAAQTDPKLKADFLDSERRWLVLAQSYEFTERLTDFSGETKRNVDKLPRV
jgi:hypothetical protein